jgi:hypothetical protein
MRAYKSFVLTAAGAFAGIAGIALLSPRHSEAQSSSDAQLASPARVVNSVTGPALTSRIDEPGRIPYQATVRPNCAGGANCFFNFATIPAGHRLVIQHVSGILSFNAPVPGFLGFISTGGGATNTVGLAPGFASTPFAAFDQAVQVYIDAPHHRRSIFHFRESVRPF